MILSKAKAIFTLKEPHFKHVSRLQPIPIKLLSACPATTLNHHTAGFQGHLESDSANVRFKHAV